MRKGKDVGRTCGEQKRGHVKQIQKRGDKGRHGENKNIKWETRGQHWITIQTT